MRRRGQRRVGLAVAVSATLGLFIAIALTAGAGGAPRPAVSTREPMRSGLDSGTGEAKTTRSVEEPAGEVRWTVTSYETADGPCVEVVADEVDGTDQAGVRGCGRADDPLLRWSMGGVEVGGQWFNVAFGQVPPDAASVRLTLGDGTVRTDSDVQADGLWIVVVPGEPTDAGREPVRVDVVDDDGVVMTTEELPSIVEYREQASIAESEETARG